MNIDSPPPPIIGDSSRRLIGMSYDLVSVLIKDFLFSCLCSNQVVCRQRSPFVLLAADSHLHLPQLCPQTNQRWSSLFLFRWHWKYACSLSHNLGWRWLFVSDMNLFVLPLAATSSWAAVHGLLDRSRAATFQEERCCLFEQGEAGRQA